MTDLPERNEWVRNLDQAGVKQCVIAEIIGVTPSRVCQLLAEFGNRDSTEPLHGLMSGPRNRLLAAGIDTREKVRAAIESGEIYLIRGIGRRKVREIQGWLPPQHQQSKMVQP